jgi:Protein of unknown function (DUF4235)
MGKLFYRATGTAVSVLGGMAATAIFHRLWRVAADEEEAPSATDPRRSWPEILIAAALDGAIFAVVKAVLDRGIATAARELTGTWPGDGDEGDAAAEAPRAN